MVRHPSPHSLHRYEPDQVLGVFLSELSASTVVETPPAGDNRLLDYTSRLRRGDDLGGRSLKRLRAHRASGPRMHA